MLNGMLLNYRTCLNMQVSGVDMQPHGITNNIDGGNFQEIYLSQVDSCETAAHFFSVNILFIKSCVQPLTGIT